MLKPAFYHKDKLNEVYKNIVYHPDFFFLIENVWDFEINIESNDEHRLQMVSINKNGDILGYLCADLDRGINMVTGLEIINFGKNGFTFSKDFNAFILDLLYVKKFRKVKFEAIVGSPGEVIYDRHLKAFNGRVVGILKKEARLQNGQFYDVKIYEIFPRSEV